MPTVIGSMLAHNGPPLRPYQRDVIDAVARHVSGHTRRLLLVAATGAGKTVIARELIREAVDLDSRVLFLVHRRELILQASRKLHAAGIDHGIVAAGFPVRPGQRVQVGSIPTVHARAIRSAAMELPAADLLLVDEGHHATARSWRRLIDAYPSAVVIGLTATPCRGDGRGLGGIFQAIVECPQIPALIADGYLVPAKVYAPSTPDLAGVHVRHGDYVESELAARVDTGVLVGDVVAHWHRLANRRRTICFAVSVGHSVHLRDEFARSGVVAEHVDGTTPVDQRDAILARLAAGTTEVVTNCQVLTEGFDQPEIGCVILARPTKSFALYRQMIGRGLRPADGKDHVLVLDHAGATFAHGLIEEPVVWTLREDRRAARASQASGGRPMAPVLTTCPECKAVRWQGRPCPACGWRPPPKPAPVDVVDGELVEVGKARHDYSDDDKARWRRELAGVAHERGYAPGWIAHNYRKKFGQWPPWGAVEPATPSDEVRAWVRSGLIRYAKTRAAS